MRTLSQALFLFGCCENAFFLRVSVALRLQRTRRRGQHRTARTAAVRANAAILVAMSALSVCSISATDRRGRDARASTSAHQDQDRLDGDDGPQRRQIEP